MKKVQLFKETNLYALQEGINAWLAANKSAEIIHSNLSAYAIPALENGDNEQLVFYILYNDAPPLEVTPLGKLEEPLPLQDATAAIAKDSLKEEAPTASLAN